MIAQFGSNGSREDGPERDKKAEKKIQLQVNSMVAEIFNFMHQKVQALDLNDALKIGIHADICSSLTVDAHKHLLTFIPQAATQWELTLSNALMQNHIASEGGPAQAAPPIGDS